MYFGAEYVLHLLFRQCCFKLNHIGCIVNFIMVKNIELFVLNFTSPIDFRVQSHRKCHIRFTVYELYQKHVLMKGRKSSKAVEIY